MPDVDMIKLLVEKNVQTKAPPTQASGSGAGSGDASPTTKQGYDKGEVVSALQKAIRRGEEERALFWAAELLDSGDSYRMWRRLVVIAAEDVGLADPTMCARIFTMYEAHLMAREWNIPFLAVMMLCRSPKNREADDASYLYEQKRAMPGGWKIKMPAEAIDGHTRQGRTNLYRMADARGSTWKHWFNVEFYYDAALLKGYVENEGGDVFRRRLMEMIGLPYKTYDINECDGERLLTGGVARETNAATLATRIPVEAEAESASHDPATGEALPEDEEGMIWQVPSFTTEGTTYVVDLREPTCTCPAYQRSGGALCKHIVFCERKLAQMKRSR